MSYRDIDTAFGENGAAATTSDRRSEHRYQASGKVYLVIDGSQPISVPGRLLDCSQHGMRIQHMYPALTSGTMLKIEAAGQTYTARVVWNRINEEGVESGFYLL
jgi:hypothetical protein